LVARGLAWTVDLPWTVNQYLFSMVFFGPVVCGLAAWQGRSLWTGHWLARVHPLRAIRAYLGAVLVPAVAVFLAGLAAAIGMAMQRGTPFEWGLGQTADVGVALVGVVAYSAVGFAAGVWRPVLVVPAVAAGVAFAITMAGWIGGFETLVRFGGASGGVLGIEVRPDVWVVRALFWGGCGLVALAAALARLRRYRWARLISFAAAISVSAGLVWAAVIPSMFREAELAWICEGDNPPVCVPDRMRRFLPQITSTGEPLLLAREMQAASANTAPTWRISDSLLFADLAAAKRSEDPDVTVSATARLLTETQSLHAPVCLDDPDRALTPEQDEALYALSLWVYLATDPWTTHTEQEFAEAKLPQATLGSQKASAFLADTLDILPPCPR
jgi:hypothetical protein